MTIDYILILGFMAVAFAIASLSMRTMIPLRLTGIVSNILFIAYGYLFWSVPTLVQHLILLPLNSYRLREMLKLVREVEKASKGDLSMDWLKPFMTRRDIRLDEVLFTKGDAADRLFYVVSGKLYLQEIDVNVAPGDVVGELGMLAPDRLRTQTLRCIEAGCVLEIGYDRIKELYFQNPSFGFFFLQLSTARLFQNINRLETALGERDREIRRLKQAALG